MADDEFEITVDRDELGFINLRPMADALMLEDPKDAEQYEGWVIITWRAEYGGQQAILNQPIQQCFLDDVPNAVKILEPRIREQFMQVFGLDNQERLWGYPIVESP